MRCIYGKRINADCGEIVIKNNNKCVRPELLDLIDAALLDLGIAGVTEKDTNNPLIRRAVITYVRMHFGQPDDYERLKASYDEQKAQMSMATGYTEWTEAQ